MTESDDVVRKAREENKKREIIERLREKTKRSAEKFGDAIADGLLKDIDSLTIDYLEEIEKDADKYLNGGDPDDEQTKFDFELDDDSEEDDD